MPESQRFVPQNTEPIEPPHSTRPACDAPRHSPRVLNGDAHRILQLELELAQARAEAQAWKCAAEMGRALAEAAAQWGRGVLSGGEGRTGGERGISTAKKALTSGADSASDAPAMLTPPPTVTEDRRLVSNALKAWTAARIVEDETRVRNAEKQARRIATVFASEKWTRLDEPTRDGITAHLNRLQSEGCPVSTRGGNASPKTVATLLAQLNGFFAWCVRDERISVNPCDGIRRTARKGRKGPNTRRGMRALYADEPIRLIRAAGRAERAIVYRIALTTGGRKGQLTREPGADPIRWRDVDLEGRRLVFVDTKNGENWPIPLVDEAIAAFREWRERCPLAGPNDHVFPFRVQDRHFNADLKAAGIPKVGGPTNRPANFHSLRKTYCTNIVMAGVPVAVAQKLMQHKTLEMTLSVYTEVRDDSLDAGLAKVQDFFQVGKVRQEWGIGRISGSGNPLTNGFSVDMGGGLPDDVNAMLTVPQSNQHPSVPGGRSATVSIATFHADDGRLELSGVVGGGTGFNSFSPVNAEGRTRTADLRVMNPAL